MNLSIKHILITGATGGIGRAFAKKSAARGNSLYLVVRKSDPHFMEELTQLGAKAVIFLEADLSSSQATQELCEKIKTLPIDAVFNNAGLLTGGLIEKQDWDDIEKMLQVNLHALIRISQALIPGMVKRGQGKIINNASVSGVMYFPCASTYAASKAAVVAFTECLEVELKGTGVTTLLLITPGIKTRMYDQIKPLYGKNLKIPDHHISPEEFCDQIFKAIESDASRLGPPLLSMSGIGLFTARYFQSVFKRSAAKSFRR